MHLYGIIYYYYSNHEDIPPPPISLQSAGSAYGCMGCITLLGFDWNIEADKRRGNVEEEVRIRKAKKERQGGTSDPCMKGS